MHIKEHRRSELILGSPLQHASQPRLCYGAQFFFYCSTSLEVDYSIHTAHLKRCGKETLKLFRLTSALSDLYFCLFRSHRLVCKRGHWDQNSVFCISHWHLSACTSRCCRFYKSICVCVCCGSVLFLNLISPWLHHNAWYHGRLMTL